MNNPLNLYPHNLEGYDDVKKAYQEGKDIVGVVRATGTGKSYIGLQLAYDILTEVLKLENIGKNIIYVVPSNSIIEHLEEIINNYPEVANTLKKINFRTYQSFINMNEEQMSQLKCDCLIVDELHHLGAPVWGSRIKQIIDTHPNIKVFGMTAYTIRDRGTAYERDMTLEGGDELFSDKIVNRYDIVDAMIDGVLPKMNYKSAYINLLGTVGELEGKINSMNYTKKEYQEYMSILNSAKKRIQEAPTIADVLKKNLKPNGKYIYFCPISPEEGVNDIETIQKQMISYLQGKYKEEDIVFYTTTSDMGSLGKDNRDAFYNDKTLDKEDCSNKLRIMFTKNQYNEGVHAPNIDGVILGRKTQSDIVYFEHIGRALSVRGNTTGEYNDLKKLTQEELLKIAKERDIDVNENISREVLIEKLLSPLIIDLVCNYEFIKELEDNLKNRVKEVYNGKSNNHREVKIKDVSFDIEIENIEIFNLLTEVKERISNNWNKMYEYACIYYEHHGNLEVPYRFKTSDGYTYDEFGKINLGAWIANQRVNVSSESERGKLLSKLNFRFDKFHDCYWKEMYKYACIYYEHHGNLEVPSIFKTSDGYTYDEDGKINLGAWIANQRVNVSSESERGKLLSKLNFRFDKLNAFYQEEMYKYACIYYEHHGNLEVPKKFKTNDGYTYDEFGKINLGQWVYTQRKTVSSESEQGKLLSKLNFRFDKFHDCYWKEMYKYACIYYEHHGNLEVPYMFKTSNGYIFDENGKFNLGVWITDQRKRVSPESEQGKLLSKLNFRFENKNSTASWKEMYKYACLYYEHYGNLEVPQKFRTNDGYTYDEFGKINLGTWIATQRSNYKTKNLSSDKINLLEDIGMIWFKESIDNKLQEELITDKNSKKKQLEVLNRVSTLLHKIGNKEINLKKDIEDINNEFINQLNKKSR